MTELTPEIIELLNEEAGTLRTTPDEIVHALGRAVETFPEFSNSLACLCEIDLDRLVEVGFEEWIAENEQEVADFHDLPVETVREYRRRQEWLPSEEY